MNSSPFEVNEYSTRGGTSGYTLRLIKPSDSSSRSCFDYLAGGSKEQTFEDYFHKLVEDNGKDYERKLIIHTLSFIKNRMLFKKMK